MKNTIVAFILCACCTVHAQYGNAKKGDIININGVKAIVFTINEDGHGTAMSVSCLRGKKKAWCANKDIADQLPAYSEYDGKANTDSVLEYISSNGLNLSDFPAFEWCRSLGDGWYLPSVKQMEKLINFFLGNEQEYDWNNEDENDFGSGTASIKELNEKIINNGGVPLRVSAGSGYGRICIYTSTKSSDNKIYTFEMNTAKNTWYFKKHLPIGLNQLSTGRAFYDF